jgi:hypothetical protein
MQFLSGAGLAKMRALVPVTELASLSMVCHCANPLPLEKIEFPVTGKNHSQNFDFHSLIS